MADESVLDARASDPIVLGWMQGFPPSPEMTIRFTDPDDFAFPKLRWTVCHFRELMPSVAVPTAPGDVKALPEALDPNLDNVTFTPLGGEEAMTWDRAFDAKYTDGLLVLHQGRIAYERYDGCLDENTLHGAMSVTKSLTGLVAEVLVAEGKLDETVLMADLIPELGDSAFGSATVQQVLEMTTALDYSEDYSDPDAEVWTYAEAGSPLPKPEGYTGPRSYFEYLKTVEQDGTHGEVFGYKTVNSDVAGWQIARTTGVIDNSDANLLFMADGSLAGNATCNRLVGSYESADGALTIGQTGTTRMACPPALETQERALLTVLENVASYSIDDSRTLVLTASDGATITARRR